MDKSYLRNTFQILLLATLIFGCRNESVEMPEKLYGDWRSKRHHPDISFDSDSAGAFVVVHHRTNDGRICSIRYPLHLNSKNRGIIQAQGRIILYFDSLKHTLYLSPGGEYNR